MVGHVREHNEDSFLTAPELGLWVVADGMGGHAAGEVASQIVCEQIEVSVSGGKSLEQAIADAQAAITRAIKLGHGAPGMGTTVVAALVHGGRYEIRWVGDSRAYLWDGKQLRLLTHDHSFVQELLDQGAITCEEAESHPEKSTLTRCIGGGDMVEGRSDRLSNSFFANELLILCTDGICGELSFEEIEQVVKQHTETSNCAQQLCKALVDSALERGGNDNATAVVVAAPAEAPKRVQQTAPHRSINLDSYQGKVSRMPSILILIVIVTLLLATIFFWTRSHEALEDSDGLIGLNLHHRMKSTAHKSVPIGGAGHSVRRQVNETEI